MPREINFSSYEYKQPANRWWTAPPTGDHRRETPIQLFHQMNGYSRPPKIKGVGTRNRKIVRIHCLIYEGNYYGDHIVVEKCQLGENEEPGSRIRTFALVSLRGPECPHYKMFRHSDIELWSGNLDFGNRPERTLDWLIEKFEARKKKEDNMNEILFLRHCAIKKNDFVTAHILSFIV